MSALTARRKTQGAYADMGLTPVVGILESHWVVLEAELSEIKKDTAALRMLVRAARSNTPPRMRAEGTRARAITRDHAPAEGPSRRIGHIRAP